MMDIDVKWGNNVYKILKGHYLFHITAIYDLSVYATTIE